MLLLFLPFTFSLFYFPHEEKSFLSWMRSTNQYYTGEEYQFRFGIYLVNSRFVKEHNSQNTRFTVGLNKFATFTPAEYKSLLGFRMNMKKIHHTSTKPSRRMFNAESIDWRDKGVVNEIKDQGECGSDWAFSTIQAAESANAISSGNLNIYSEQNLVDCVTDCYGCYGGSMIDAYNYITTQQNGHFVSQKDYKYKGIAENCKFSQYTPIGSLSSYISAAEGNEDDLASKIETYGVAAAAMDASNTSFELYIGGIYDESSCSKLHLDHAVGVVGYGKENDTKYWIIRNSWGTSWGEFGYMRLLWNNNQCGIASMSSVLLA